MVNSTESGPAPRPEEKTSVLELDERPIGQRWAEVTQPNSCIASEQQTKLLVNKADYLDPLSGDFVVIVDSVNGHAAAPHPFLDAPKLTTADNKVDRPGSNDIRGDESSRAPSLQSRTAIYASLPLLKPRMTRVADLELNRETGQVALTLRVVDLDHRPVFNALSYCWGTDYNSHTLHNTDGNSIGVTSNCYDAVQQLGKLFSSITIWIDAISINQSDDGEKSRQIPLMRDIYSSARIVYIWLGKGNAKTDAAMDYLAKGGLPFRISTAKKGRDDIPTGNAVCWKLAWYIYSRTITSRRRPHYDGLMDVFDREWIRRIWTMQEALLAHKPVLMCGDKTASWKGVVYSLELFQFLSKKPAFITFPPKQQQWWRLWNLQHALILQGDLGGTAGITSDGISSLQSEIQTHRHTIERAWRRFVFIFLLIAFLAVSLFLGGGLVFFFALFQHGRANATILIMTPAVPYLLLLAKVSGNQHATRCRPFSTTENIFFQIWERQSTDCKDRYYGVQALIGKEEENRLTCHRSISQTRVYRRLSLALLRWTQSLDILLWIGCDKEDPSWVVDWAPEARSWVLLLYYHTSTWWNRWDLTSEFIYGRLKGATPDSESNWKTDGYKTKLVVYGKMIGELCWRSERPPEAPPGFQSAVAEDLSLSVMDFRKAIEGMEVSQITQIMDQLSTITVSYGPGDKDNIKFRKKWIQSIYGSIEKGPEWGIQQLNGKNPLRLSKFLRWIMGPNPACGFHYEMVKYMAENQRVLVRSTGVYSGFGISCTCSRVGDKVALISGVSMPLILRKHERGYVVVGPAFFGGVMNGEFWKDNGKDALEELVLA